MGQLYNFSRLLRRYSVDFALETPAPGGYVDGVWQKRGTTLTAMRGAVVPLPEKILRRPEGDYTAKDRQLYVTAPLAENLEGLHVIHGGSRYSVEEETDHTEYGNVAVYLLRWVSAFDTDGADRKGGGAGAAVLPEHGQAAPAEQRPGGLGGV